MDCCTTLQSLPKKAVILAAGLGTRLRPLTWLRPKPLVPVFGRPLILHLVDMLERWGVEEALVNLHWQPEHIREALTCREGRVRLEFFPEREIQGTGGALRAMQARLKDAPFWIVNADIVASLKPEPLVRALEQDSRLIAAAWVDPRRGPRTVEIGADATIANYRSARRGTPGTATFCGVQVVKPDLLGYLPATGACSLVDLYERADAAGRPVAGVQQRRSYWADAGTVANYLRIHEEIRRRHRRGQAGGEWWTTDTSPVATPLCGAHGAERRGYRSSAGRHVVLWPGARVCAGARLSRTVVADGVVADGTWRDAALIPALAAPQPVVAHAAERMGWPAAETAAAFLGERGSNRGFWRLGWGRRRAILVTYGLERTENARYAGHARVLGEAGVPVPNVLAELPQEQALVLEDWGSDALEQRVKRRPEAVLALYEPVLQAAARLHTAATELACLRGVALEPPFDARVYGWEHDLFRNHLLLPRCKTVMTDGVAAELRRVAERLLAAPRVIVHRDFQSSNVLCRGRRIALIDFQGMRFGPAAYDLASLVCDPYVPLSPAQRAQLRDRYAALYPAGAAVAELLPWAAVQRLVQALGAFGRLSALGHARFATFIAPAAGTLAEMARLCRLSELAALAAEIARRERLAHL